MEFYAASLGEYYSAIDEIAKCENGVDQDRGEVPLLWYRGLPHNHYNLLPTLYRNQAFSQQQGIIYNQVKRMEDLRYQHYKSRVFHVVNTNPNLQSEWLEIYQHYLGKTRLLDWSESARTSLNFALEPYIDSRVDPRLEKERETLTPVVAVMNPHKLNDRVYDFFCNHPQIIEKALTEFSYLDIKTRRSVFAREISDTMQKNKEIFFTQAELEREMQGIVSLCVLEGMRNMEEEQLLKKLMTYEFNPFYYLVLRYYTDALPICIRDQNQIFIPPLAILHPYHSERIRKQRGTFSIFPNYVFEDDMKGLLKCRNIDVREMERQVYINSLIHKIYIVNPREIAKELLYSGERRTELYPELDSYTSMLETSRFYV